jgi:F-type H+-transporting ATPase subunit b
MESLGVDGKLLVAQIINFGLFFALFSKIFAKPFLKYVTEQQNIQKEKDRILHELKKKEIELSDREKQILKAANEQAIKIVTDAKNQATEIREEAVVTAQEEAAEVKIRANKQISDERGEMVREIEDKVIKTTESLTKKVLTEFLDDSKQMEIIDNLLKKLK